MRRCSNSFLEKANTSGGSIDKTRYDGIEITASAVISGQSFIVQYDVHWGTNVFMKKGQSKIFSTGSRNRQILQKWRWIWFCNDVQQAVGQRQSVEQLYSCMVCQSSPVHETSHTFLQGLVMMYALLQQNLEKIHTRKFFFTQFSKYLTQNGSPGHNWQGPELYSVERGSNRGQFKIPSEEGICLDTLWEQKRDGTLCQRTFCYVFPELHLPSKEKASRAQ